jgi:small subunit ribosomal protein S8
MSMTDPIADLLTRIRNALGAEHPQLSVPRSKMKLAIVQILTEEGYIDGFEVNETGPQGSIEITLKYGHGGEPAITGIQRVSRPGRRVYRGKGEIPRVLNGLGVTIMSTPRGVMTGVASVKNEVGGEVLCSVW